MINDGYQTEVNKNNLEIIESNIEKYKISIIELKKEIENCEKEIEKISESFFCGKKVYKDEIVMGQNYELGVMVLPNHPTNIIVCRSGAGYLGRVYTVHLFDGELSCYNLNIDVANWKGSFIDLVKHLRKLLAEFIENVICDKKENLKCEKCEFVKIPKIMCKHYGCTKYNNKN